MPKKFVTIAAVISVSVIAAALLMPAGGNGGGAGLTPIADEAAYRRILENSRDKLVVIDFYADWCSPCRQLAPILKKIAARFEKEVDFYKVDVDAQRTLARKAGVRGIPYVLFVTGGKPVHAMTGLNPREAYVRAVQRFAPEPTQDGPEGPDGELVEGVRVVARSAQAAFDSVYVYRGETVRLRVNDIEFPYGIAIPQYGIQQDAVPGRPLEVTFKAKKTGVFPVFCNGRCPAGEASRHGQVVVMPFEASDHIAYAEIDAAAAKALIDADAPPLILDVRTPGEYYAGHIAGARLIPVQQLQARIKEIADHKNKKILVYCRSGNRSVVASEILVADGFKDIAHLRGGILDWMKAGFPLTN
jgi:thioredoxin